MINGKKTRSSCFLSLSFSTCAGFAGPSGMKRVIKTKTTKKEKAMLALVKYFLSAYWPSYSTTHFTLSCQTSLKPVPHAYDSRSSTSVFHLTVTMSISDESGLVCFLVSNIIFCTSSNRLLRILDIAI